MTAVATHVGAGLAPRRASKNTALAHHAELALLMDEDPRVAPCLRDRKGLPPVLGDVVEQPARSHSGLASTRNNDTK